MYVKTRNGTFSNQGYGGGVFNYNTAFGSYDPDTPGNISGLIGIGALPANRAIPHQCWEKPGFKDCHAVAWREARDQCEYCAQNPQDEANCGGYTSLQNCIDRVSNNHAWNNCVATFCPAQDPAMQDVLKNLKFTEYQKGDPCSSPNTIKNVQFVVGTESDGRWGKLSQEAYDTFVRVQGTTYCELVPGCTGDTPVGGTCGAQDTEPKPILPPVAPPVAPQPPVVEEKEVPVRATQSNMGVFFVAGGLLALAATVAVLGKKK